MLFSALTFQLGYNATLVTLGAMLLGGAAGVTGTFLYLRKRALVSDAIAHATLPGVGLAFIAMTLMGLDGRFLPGLLIGSAATALLGLASVQWLVSRTRLSEDAAIGSVLSVFFGFGIVILTVIQTMSTGGQAGLEGFLLGSTAGMLFITMPKLFYTVVPMGGILAPLFYVLVAFAALTSTISLLEVVVSYFIDEKGTSRAKATILCGLTTFVLTVFCALSLGGSALLTNFEWIHGKGGLFATLDHIASNWQLPIGGFFITLAAGWFMTRKSTEEELADETAPGWFRYGAWRFFIRYIAPLAVASIIAAVIFFHADFS